MNPVRIGLLGLGTVGAGTVNVLARNACEIARRAGREVQVVRVAVRDLAKHRACDLGSIVLDTDPMAVATDPDIDVVVELMGGTDAAREAILAAITAGKHVVTANKALIALNGNEIFQHANAQGVMVAFEAAVAGGIPVIKAVREGLAGNRIEWLAGIINGTGNYILTQMKDYGRDFADALAQAQALGYAEADPTFDVGGIDAAHKLCILGSIAFGIPLQFQRVYIEGITGIGSEDVAYADNLGYVIKHLGIARLRDDGIEMRVHPTLIPKRQLLASVDGVMNAVLIHADAVGPTLHYGAGAGAEPTASAVVADLVDVVRALTTDPGNRVPHLAFQPTQLAQTSVLPIDAAETAYYLRLRALDKPGVLAEIATVLGNAGISIEAVVQPEPPQGAQEANLVLLTHRVREQQMNDALAIIARLPTVSGAVTRIRVETLNGAREAG